MPAPALAPPRYDAPIGRTPDGSPVIGERAFMDYIAQQVFVRLGGAVAPTNADLAARSDPSIGAGLALAAAPDLRSTVQALQRRVADLEAEAHALRRAAPGADRAAIDAATITLGARAWR